MQRTALAFLLLLAATPLAAQNRWGLRGGISDGEAVIGGEFFMPINSSVAFNPNVEIGGDHSSLNADLTVNLFQPTRDSIFWVGGGLALIDSDANDDVDGGVNVLVGAGVRRGSLLPYVQAKFTSPFDGDSYGTAIFGIRF